MSSDAPPIAAEHAAAALASAEAVVVPAEVEMAERPDKDDATIARAEATMELLLPPGWPSAFVDRFSLVVSKRTFDGYAQQPSPCCAAASVAGACNAAQQGDGC